jgi:hypothetical protein
MNKVLAFISKLLENYGRLTLPPDLNDNESYCLFCHASYGSIDSDLRIPQALITIYKVVITTQHEYLYAGEDLVSDKELEVVKKAMFFCLCEDCWNLIGTPEERLHFYEQAMRFQGFVEGGLIWNEITDAVLEGN